MFERGALGVDEGKEREGKGQEGKGKRGRKTDKQEAKNAGDPSDHRTEGTSGQNRIDFLRVSF